MTTLYIGKTSPYLGIVLSHPYLYLDMNDKKKVVHVIYTCTLPYLTLPYLSKLVRYQVCFHLSCFSLPYLLLPTYMPDKPDKPDRPDIYYKGPV